eukprot:TRINITY_DN3196_c0_g1_i2.p1 TRINITY_DN3196_c0_g1~~TRINITY_DN3196_c0_g1_i2.p1  ORF type:complete len:198 (-),score=57.29 TRINITY_DN3196_c0_g1_i2:79-633(-)
MARSVSFLVALALMLVAVAVPALAQEVATEAPVQEYLLSSPDLVTEYIFPNNVDLKFNPGEIVELVFSMKNVGIHPITVDGMSATLYYTQDARYAIQNYSAVRANLVLQPRDDRALSYRFMPHPMLEVGDYGLYAQVYYHDWENKNYTTVYFNQTIDLVEAPSTFDSEVYVLTSFFFQVFQITW